jgi:hypothetical protein
MFRSRRAKSFRKLFAALPAEAQRQAYDAYVLFRKNPRHGSLQFKHISAQDPRVYSVRIGSHYRAIGLLERDTITWIWIGSHETYNKLEF